MTARASHLSSSPPPHPVSLSRPRKFTSRKCTPSRPPPSLSLRLPPSSRPSRRSRPRLSTSRRTRVTDVVFNETQRAKKSMIVFYPPHTHTTQRPSIAPFPNTRGVLPRVRGGGESFACAPLNFEKHEAPKTTPSTLHYHPPPPNTIKHEVTCWFWTRAGCGGGGVPSPRARAGPGAACKNAAAHPRRGGGTGGGEAWPPRPPSPPPPGTACLLFDLNT